MSNPERLRTMEALWEVMCQQSEEPQSPGWHREILAQRNQRLAAGNPNFISVEEARKRLQG